MSNFNSPEVAVIPAAGKGTRFLPSTKATPKELHPLLSKPLLHHSMEELKEAGVKEIILVNHPEKKGLNKYFEPHDELKSVVSSKPELLEALDSVEALPKMTMVYQNEQKGLAHAISCATEAINGRNFFVLLPDEIFIPQTLNENPSKALAESYKESGTSVISLLEVPKDQVSSYGVAKFEDNDGQIKIVDLVEKPKIEDAPSNLILPGRYLFDNKILDWIQKTPERNGEVQLTDAMVSMSKEQGLNGLITDCPRFDGGSVLGFLKANIFAGLKDDKISSDLRLFIEQAL